MKLKASDRVAQTTKKPKIKKGYYPGRLVQVKPRQDQEGNWIESKFGRQIILLFEVFQNDKPMPNPEKPEENLVLAQVLNSEYKDEKNGGYRTAVTKNSRITKVFEALGWKFSPDGFDTQDFIGKFVELNVDDYEATDADGNTYKASSIKDINKLEGDSPSPTPVPEKKEVNKQVKSTELSAEKQARIDKMKKMHAEGMLSDGGLAKAIEQIENE